jgi:poly(ribitol-phosphate) beta-N-acetylglucosaminyltransferase
MTMPLIRTRELLHTRRSANRATIRAMRPFVSVVVPVHNPGRYIEPCIRSLLRQTMSRDRFEVVFVDDGSTDGTGDRLDRLVREQPNVRVIHIPASGAPGRPRNVGIEAAHGEYIQFLDADDELAPRALDRLVRMARTNGSDVVLGKFASETLNRRQDLFIRNRPATTLAETPQLIDASMGPTKLFRTAFLREHELSFPEGWRQMEDQLFTMRAYLASGVISILGDEPCYFFNKREDEGHISSELVDPESHVAHLAEIVDEIEDADASPALRRRLLSRFHRLEILARLASPQFLAASPAYQQALFSGLERLAHTRFAEVQDGLGAFARIRTRLLHEGSLDGIRALGERIQRVGLDVQVAGAAWERGRLEIEFRATLTNGADGGRFTLIERDGTYLLDPALADDLVGPVAVTDEVGSIRAQVSLVDRETALEWIIPAGTRLSIKSGGGAGSEHRLPVLLGSVAIDPQRVGPGERPLDDGMWDVRIRWLGLGMHAEALLALPPSKSARTDPSIRPALLGRPTRWIVPLADRDGTLRLGIGGPDRAPARLATAGRRLLRDGPGLSIELPVATDRSGEMASGIVRFTGEPGVFDVPATFVGAIGALVVSVRAGSAARIPRGRYELSAHVGGATAPGLAAGAVIVREDGRFVAVGLRGVPQLARLRAVAGWSIRSATTTMLLHAMSAYRRLPGRAREAIRSGYGRLRA